MMSIRESLAYCLYRMFHITPNALCLFRIFATPWLNLLIAKSLIGSNLTYLILVVIFYALVVFTDALDGPLARRLAREGVIPLSGEGAVLDRISDKLLVVMCLIPFGASLPVVVVLITESVLAYQALYPAKHTSVSATLVGKIKMVLQGVVIPVLLVADFLDYSWLDSLAFILLSLAAVFSVLSLISHYLPHVLHSRTRSAE